MQARPLHSYIMGVYFSAAAAFFLIASRIYALQVPVEESPSKSSPPFGNSPFMTLKGYGKHTYRCIAVAAGKTVYEEVQTSASLFSMVEMTQKEENVVGYHYFLNRADGQGGRFTWSSIASVGESTSHIPTSTITAAVIEEETLTSNATGLPNLLLKATSHSGNGPLSRVSYVQRLDAVGGAPPQVCSHVDHIIEVPYHAHYTFWAQEIFVGEEVVPWQVHAPRGHRAMVGYYGEGYQIYEFNGTSWKLVNVSAYLSSLPGQQVLGHHYFLSRKDRNGGAATWEMFLPKSRVTCKMVRNMRSDARSINWVLLQATSHGGDEFMFGKVSFVQRLSTRDGLPPSGGSSKVGEIHLSSYSSIYWFYVKA